MGLRYWKCSDYPAYDGPNGVPPTKRRRDLALEQGAVEPEQVINETANAPPGIADPAVAGSTNASVRVSVRGGGLGGLLPRQLSGLGSFLDPSAFLYLGCANYEDYDPCAEGFGCYVDTTNGDAPDDDGGWGDAVGDGGGGNGDGDGDGNGDGGGDGDNEPSPYNWGVIWGNSECTVDDVSQWGDQVISCSRPYLSGTGVIAASVRGFTKGNLKACFYTSADCTASDSPGYAIISGGDHPAKHCTKLEGGKDIFSWEITDGKCDGDGLDDPDPSRNEKDCYNSGEKSDYEAIVAAAESFCHNVVDDDSQGEIRSNYRKTATKQPASGYHFDLEFEVKEGCGWKADFDNCMRYLRVPIDSCDCSKKGEKQGGTVSNNCLYARIDPNHGS
ncbi:hypothetical protein F4824DRAFT_363645 [Ustulina deusta]|nr:hypothetical protein F4824DRAFT_363645 [Ustulina deusta]